MGGLSDAQARLIDDAAAAAAGPASLGDIQHVVILMQENRSFDHYFGTMSGVRGFSDPHAITQSAGGRSYPIFDQFGYQPGQGADPSGYLQPFRLSSDPPLRDGQATNDISHTWPTQHRSWNGGAMDKFVATHVSADGAENGPVTMGYYTREDLPFYHALADAFTVCDGYFSSVIGPTGSNRLMAVSASIDPEGVAGGPVVETLGNRIAEYGKLTWETMPQRLQAAGVSWKVYNDRLGELALSPLPYFKAFTDPFSVTGIELVGRGLTPRFPDDFAEDVQWNKLPSVSWITPPLAQCEHPAAPPAYGEYLVQSVLTKLVSNPAVWAQTVLFVVHDENGGFFDHVPSPTAPPGTAGEWLTAKNLPAAAEGITGPIGLGFRAGGLVISPFSRGGYVCSETFDHTSLLRFIETRFGVEVPNLSAWRRGVTGDLTAALALSRPPDASVPPLPPTFLGQTSAAEQAVLNSLAGTLHMGIPYPLPRPTPCRIRKRPRRARPCRSAHRGLARARPDQLERLELGVVRRRRALVAGGGVHRVRAHRVVLGDGDGGLAVRLGTLRVDVEDGDPVAAGGVAALAELAVAASRPVPPAAASTLRRDIAGRDGAWSSELAGTTRT